MSVFERALKEEVGIPYLWGGSDTAGTDCSGSVCLALSAYLGRKVRVNADTLARKFFTPFVSPGPMAMFYYRDGKAYHVSGYAGGGFFLNLSKLDGSVARLRTLEHLSELYGKGSLLYLRRDLCL